MRNLKHTLLAGLMVAGIVGLGAQSAEEIIDKAQNRIQVDTTSTRAQMIITAKDGSTTERLVDQYSSKKDGLNRGVIIFQKPANVSGTRFLTLENKGREEDRWIFLPSLGKIRRIAGSEGSGSFMGTDFSYDDMSALGREVSEDTHRILKEESLNAMACWVIESVSKDPGYQYSKSIRWYSKDKYLMLKAEMYDSKGQLLKVMEMGEFKEIQGILTPTSTKMSNVQQGSSTTVTTSIIKYNDKIPDGVFTTRYLETGRY